jgi:predicted GIY-YIG superfamily endonuclease
MSKRTAVYRIFGDASLLLYIGISDNFGRRWQQHARQQPWWDEHRQMTIDWHETRELAKTAETAAIKTEGPKFNVIHADGEHARKVRQDNNRKKEASGRILGELLSGEPLLFPSDPEGRHEYYRELIAARLAS